MPRPAGRFDGGPLPLPLPLPFSFFLSLPSSFLARFLTGHLPASLVNMSGPSFGQRAIALTTSSCHRGVAQGRSRDGSFPSSGEYTAIRFSALRKVRSRQKKRLGRKIRGVDRRRARPSTINVYGAAPSFFSFYAVS